MGTIHHPQPAPRRKKELPLYLPSDPYLWYIHACAVGLLYKNKCCLNDDYKVSRRCDRTLCKSFVFFVECELSLLAQSLRQQLA